MKKLLATTTAVAGLALAFAAPALAVPLTGTFLVNVYQGNNSSHLQTDATQQALPSAIAAITAQGTYISPPFTYTGSIDLTAPTEPTSLSAFFLSAGGVTSIGLPNTPLSSGNFTNETLVKFTFTTSAIAGNILHDDGISLFASGNTTAPILDSSAPTSVVSTPFALAGGTYDLYYSEVNGAPARLTFDVTRGNPTTVPEPVSMALIGAGLLGVGLMRRTSRQG